jgi:hypothetical protein
MYYERKCLEVNYVAKVLTSITPRTVLHGTEVATTVTRSIYSPYGPALGSPTPARARAI